jgi:hypothetical protein
MYDLTVDVAHTFFVGAAGWLVHNNDICDISAGIARNERGKIHTDGHLPSRPPSNWNREELEQAAVELRGSIRTRKIENSTHPNGHDPGHQQRIGEEQTLLRSIEKLLSGT